MLGFVQVFELCVLLIDEICEIVDQYCVVVCYVIEVGFDGVELYGVNGYFVNQFIDLNVNMCIDVYGGLLENWLWFLCEVMQVLIDGIGDVLCVGICFVLLIMLNGCVDDDLEIIYFVVVKLFGEFGVGYLYIVEVDWDDVLLMLVVFKQ